MSVYAIEILHSTLCKKHSNDEHCIAATCSPPEFEDGSNHLGSWLC